MTLPITFVGTVAENSNDVQLSTRINTGGANYSDDVGLGYDVCGFAINSDSLPSMEYQIQEVKTTMELALKYLISLA